MAGINKLSAVKVAKLAEPGRYGDGGGLWLQVSDVGPNITKSWLFRYTRHGRARQMGLGSFITVSLAEAREMALDARKLVNKGVDPIDARRERKAADKAAVARAMNFKECAEAYIAAHRPEWKNPKHAAQWSATMTTYVYPVFGNLPVALVDTALVMKALNPIWTKIPETASRVRSRIESILGWATTSEFRQGDNPARWNDHLKNLLPARGKVAKVEHHPALPYVAIPGFMASLRDMSSISARALEFTILTAARTGEVIGANHSELDLEAKLWIVPAERMKAGKEHRVPLSDRCIEILKALPRVKGNAHIFPGARAGKPLSDMAMLQLLRGMDSACDFTVHGFRSSFRVWCAERTNYPREIAEAALAHKLKNKVEAAYNRGDLLEKRRRLMRDWAIYCKQAPSAVNVTPIRGAA